MRRLFFIAGVVLAVMLLAALGTSISLARSARSKVRARRPRARTAAAPSLA